jgi:hypothetical protein
VLCEENDNHSELLGWQVRFRCPDCDALIRFDQDEIKFTAHAIPAEKHS